MIFDMKRVVIELEYRGIVPVKDAMGTRIDCLRGRIWITERGTDDVVLEAGQSYEVSRGGVAVVQALREALVALRAPAVPKAAGAGLAARVERLWRAWPAGGAGGHPAIAQLGSDCP
jgi:Protein of unknown function (DUF2917)